LTAILLDDDAGDAKTGWLVSSGCLPIVLVPVRGPYPEVYSASLGENDLAWPVTRAAGVARDAVTSTRVPTALPASRLLLDGIQGGIFRSTRLRVENTGGRVLSLKLAERWMRFDGRGYVTRATIGSSFMASLWVYVVRSFGILFQL